MEYESENSNFNLYRLWILLSIPSEAIHVHVESCIHAYALEFKHLSERVIESTIYRTL